MSRYPVLFALILLPVLVSVSCTRKPGPEFERPVTRPVPDADELANWRQAMRPVWDQFSDTIGADIIVAAEAMSE